MRRKRSYAKLTPRQISTLELIGKMGSGVKVNGNRGRALARRGYVTEFDGAWGQGSYFIITELGKAVVGFSREGYDEAESKAWAFEDAAEARANGEGAV